MKISLLQRDVVWKNPKENLNRLDTLMEKIKPADLYVLPEMFTTGFVLNPDETTDQNGITLQWMKKTALKYHCALAGSASVKDGPQYFNRLYFVKPDGTEIHYDKHHLFSYSGENKHYKAGNKRIIVKFLDTRIMLQICYDLRFPIFSRNHGDYDVLLYVANWPESRINIWKILLQARAIENQCYVVAVNRTGSDPTNYYNGGSLIMDANGRTITECKENIEDEVSAEIHIKALQDFRKRFPVLEDADPPSFNPSSQA